MLKFRAPMQYFPHSGIYIVETNKKYNVMKRMNVWAAIALTMMVAVTAGCSKADSNADNNVTEPQPEPVVTPDNPVCKSFFK